jgi:RHS repeat-associated protein
MADGIGTTTFSYTPLGQLESESGPWASDTITYAYSDQLKTGLDLQQPNASDWVQTYGYDSANRLNATASPAGEFGYAYNPGLIGNSSSGLVARISLPNLAFITNTYDNNGRMLGTWLYNSGLNNLDSSVYTNNVGNQRVSLTRTGENTANYTYDPIGQVIADLASETTGATRWNEQLKYGFDPAGNLNYRTNNALIQNFSVNADNELTTTMSGGSLTVVGTTTSTNIGVTVNGSNALSYADATFAATNMPLTTTYTAIAQDGYGRHATNAVTVNLATNVSFQYDANGNLISDGLRSFSYDDENQLIQVLVTNQWMSQFSYDGKMRRRIRQEFTWTNSAWVQTNAVYYVYDGNLAIQERDVNNLPTTTYTRGLDLSGSLTGAGGIGGLLARTAQSYVDTPLQGHAFYHADGNGNVTMLINSSQAVVAKYLYDAFGNVLSASGLLASANHYQFSSMEYYANAGLVSYGRRFYDPNLQRWLNKDPIAEAGGINLYRFVGNNPINEVDPYGLWTWTGAFAGVGAGVGGFAVAAASLGVDAVTGGLNTLATPAEVAGGAAAGAAAGAWVGSLFDPNPSVPTVAPSSTPTASAVPSVVNSSGFPPGYLPGPIGAAEWGRKPGGCGAAEGKRRFHGMKQGDNMSTPPSKYGVNPDTGDVIDPEGESIGNLDDAPSS